MRRAEKQLHTELTNAIDETRTNAGDVFMHLEECGIIARIQNFAGPQTLALVLGTRGETNT